jgi:hypothetical protein
VKDHVRDVGWASSIDSFGNDAMTEHHVKTERGDGVRLFCDLSALDVAQRKRRGLLDQLLQVGTVDIVELPDGYAFHVDPVSIIAQHLEEFAAFERLCCPFMTIAVGAETVGAQPVLEMRGGDAVKQFIAAEFGIRRRPAP